MVTTKYLERFLNFKDFIDIIDSKRVSSCTAYNEELCRNLTGFRLILDSSGSDAPCCSEVCRNIIKDGMPSITTFVEESPTPDIIEDVVELTDVNPAHHSEITEKPGPEHQAGSGSLS